MNAKKKLENVRNVLTEKLEECRNFADLHLLENDMKKLFLLALIIFAISCTTVKDKPWLEVYLTEETGGEFFLIGNDYDIKIISNRLPLTVRLYE